MADIKDMIVYYRKRDGYSQAELAKILGVTPATIGNYEAGIRKPRPQIEEAMADLFNISIDNLRGIDTEKKKPIYSPDLIKIIDKFPRLSKEQQQIILNTIDAFLVDKTE